MKIVTVVLTMALIVFLGSCVVENIFHCGCGCDGSGSNGTQVTPPFETTTRTHTIRIESFTDYIRSIGRMSIGNNPYYDVSLPWEKTTEQTYRFAYYVDNTFFFDLHAPSHVRTLISLSSGINAWTEESVEARRVWRENKRYIEISLFIDGELFMSLSTKKYPEGVAFRSDDRDGGFFQSTIDHITLTFDFPSLIEIRR